MLGSSRGAGKVVGHHQDSNVFGVLRQKHALLGGGKASAYHVNLLARKELAVARRAIRNAPAAVLVLALESDRARMRARSYKHGERAYIAFIGIDRFYIACRIDADSLRYAELRAEALSLVAHRRRKLLARRVRDARIVHYLVCYSYLTAEVILFQYNDAIARSCKIQRGGQPRRTAADYRRIENIFFRHRSKLPDKIETGLERFRTGLPLGGAHFVAVLMDELACQELAEKFLCVPADIACIYLVSDYLSLGIDDKRAALAHSVRFDIHLKVIGQRVRRIGEHGIGYLLYALGRVVPRLVHEMRVARHGIHLATGFLELGVFISEVLELGRAYKREIGGIEKEYAPLAEYVFFSDGLEGFVLESLYVEIGYFLIDKRHELLLEKNYFLDRFAAVTRATGVTHALEYEVDAGYAPAVRRVVLFYLAEVDVE